MPRIGGCPTFDPCPGLTMKKSGSNHDREEAVFMEREKRGINNAISRLVWDG